LGIPSQRTIILLHAVHDCPGGSNAAITRHVSFAQITCFTSDGCFFVTVLNYVFSVVECSREPKST